MRSLPAAPSGGRSAWTWPGHCGVTGEDLLIRLGAETADSALGDAAARPFDMGRGPSPGWVLIGPAGTDTDQDLTGWVQQVLAFAVTLPAK